MMESKGHADITQSKVEDKVLKSYKCIFLYIAEES